MRLFLLGLNVADDAAICDLGVLGNFVLLDEKASVSSLYAPKLLENPSNLICHALAPFEFFGTFDEVSVFLGLFCLGSDDCISCLWF